MNVFTFTGNLGKDCRTGNVGGTPVCNFSVAVTEGYGQRKKTHWVECALWGKQAESLSPYLLKGQQVAVSGEFGMKEATDKYQAAPTCRVTSISLVGGKSADKQQGSPKQAGGQQADAPAADFDDDIPF